MGDVTLHIDEETDSGDREQLRDSLLSVDGVMAAAFSQKQPHLMIIEYDPEIVSAVKFVEVARSRGLHSALVGM